ncbi:hypothetical protein [Methylomicrobium agile]|uniref:hypothetical protein n=1 Tax=Methylomicrobium agile TaxID=39774 RepID=UPI0004DEF5F1|nr:hypothetical protein [Methylomicrobium agile]
MSKLIDLLLKIQYLTPFQRKTYVSSGLIGSLILVPDLYLAGAHYTLEFLHIFYESLCFMLEELIGHSLHLSKYHSQLILFYAQVVIVAGLAYKIWRTAPRLYHRTTAYLRASWLKTIKDGKQFWTELPGRKRIKVLAGCMAGMFGLYFWATS